MNSSFSLMTWEPLAVPVNWHRPSPWQLLSVRGMAGVCSLVLVLAATGWATPAWVRSESSLAKSWGEGWRSLAALSFQPGEERAESRVELAKPPLEKEHGVRGAVALIGDPPPEREILNVPEFARARHAEPMRTRHFRVSAEGGLADVFVYIKRGLEGQKFETPEEPVILEARGCEWEPYVSGVQTGRLVLFRNADPVLHNLHFTSSSRKNPDWNRALLANAKPAEARFEFPDLFARVKGDVYPWMFAYLCVVEHPFFAVTDAGGRFELPAGLPPGQYTLAAIHRRAGEIEREIVIGRGKTEEIKLQIELREGNRPHQAQASEAASPNASPAEGEIVTGRVVDAESGEPIQRFTVTPGQVGAYEHKIVEPRETEHLADEYFRRSDEIIGASSKAVSSTSVGAADNDVLVTPGRQRLKTKLETIRLPEIRSDEVPLMAVLKQIATEDGRHDPEGEGVNFMIAGNVRNTPSGEAMSSDPPVSHEETRQSNCPDRSSASKSPAHRCARCDHQNVQRADPLFH